MTAPMTRTTTETTTDPAFTADEMMTVAAARLIDNGTVCFVGIGLPSAAANLARATHAPDAVLIYESGTIGAKPAVLPLSIGDSELAETADFVVSTSEVFRYWLQGGRITVGFLGAAQIDRFGNINTTVIGDYAAPKVRLPGAGGAPEIASLAGQVFVIMRQSKRGFVDKVEFVTSAGHLTGGDWRAATGPSRPRAHHGHHRPRHPGAPSREPRACPHPHPSGRRGGRHQGRHRLAARDRRRSLRDARAHRRRAGRAARPARAHRRRPRSGGLILRRESSGSARSAAQAAP